MRHNPRQCREHALQCIELARTARTPQQKQLLTDLAQSWINLAANIERAQVLLGEHGEGLDRSTPTMEMAVH